MNIYSRKCINILLDFLAVMCYTIIVKRAGTTAIQKPQTAKSSARKKLKTFEKTLDKFPKVCYNKYSQEEDTADKEQSPLRGRKAGLSSKKNF